VFLKAVFFGMFAFITDTSPAKYFHIINNINRSLLLSAHGPCPPSRGPKISTSPTKIVVGGDANVDRCKVGDLIVENVAGCVFRILKV